MEDKATKHLKWLLMMIMGLVLAAAGSAIAEEAEEEEIQHTESHQMVSHLHGEPEIISTDSEEFHTVVTVYDLYCLECGRVIQESYFTQEVKEAHTMQAVQIEPTCVSDGMAYEVCEICGYEGPRTVLPATGVHTFVTHDAVQPVCSEHDGCAAYQECTMCGLITDEAGEPLEEVAVIPAAPAHEFEMLVYEEPTCTQAGTMTQVCRLCGKEETIEAPALGHAYAWVTVSVPSPDAEGISEYACALCGDVKERKTVPYMQMMYNNTVTTLGPTTRDLIGGDLWNRVTPIDLGADGIFTYPMIASNRFTVGVASVVQADGWQVVTYQLNSEQFLVRSEVLAIYPNLESLRTGEGVVYASFGEPIDLRQYFPDDNRLILSIILKVDYDARGIGVEPFKLDPDAIEAMMALFD